MDNQYVVTLQAMRFHTHIGVLPHEAEIAQSIEVDLSVWTQRSEVAHGSEGVIDYRELYDLVASIIANGHIRYLEDLADRVAAAALDIQGVSRVLINVRKPHVALAGPLQHAQVSLERRR
ncbi:MAG TPA: dihydroneopterin aldolase [Gemmatimonadaceae bacterium]|jgi:dihydroneopterin aldolase|nr:dihydroneopterin aldolase [Gemmatimonadaceae bacterium]